MIGYHGLTANEWTACLGCASPLDFIVRIHWFGDTADTTI